MRSILSTLLLALALVALPAHASDFKVDRILEVGPNSISLDDTKACDLPALLVGVPAEVQRTIRAARVYYQGRSIKACYIELGDGVAVIDEEGAFVGEFGADQFKRPLRVGS